MSKKILITGGSGLLGTNWALTRRDKDDITLALNNRIISINGVETIQMTNRQSLFQQAKALQPDLIIHTAALTNVENCQMDRARAYLINAKLSEEYSLLANKLNAKFVFVSSDHLFDGNTKFANEKSSCKPLNNYAWSKYEAEKAILSNNPEALILRTNFFGWGPPYRQSFSDWILEYLGKQKQLKLYNNIFFTPLYVGQVISATHHLLGRHAKGIYHLASNERLTKLEFGIRLAKVFGLDERLIVEGEYEVNNNCARPFDMSLSNKKAQKNLKYFDFSLKKGFHELKSNQNFKNELSSIEVYK